MSPNHICIHLQNYIISFNHWPEAIMHICCYCLFVGMRSCYLHLINHVILLNGERKWDWYVRWMDYLIKLDLLSKRMKLKVPRINERCQQRKAVVMTFKYIRTLPGRKRNECFGIPTFESLSMWDNKCQMNIFAKNGVSDWISLF